jgi:large subunit ribosomal protein L6
MSRKGRMPIPVPNGVEVAMKGRQLSVKGPKGTLSRPVVDGVNVGVAEGVVTVTVAKADRWHKSLHGLYRALVANMVQGVSQGFARTLELVGVGYRAAVQGRVLDLTLGFSHPTKVGIPEGLEVKVDKGTQVVISGLDKQRVGQFAAEVRSIRPPEPYQGKGVRYQDERVRRKAGKTAKK